MTKPTAPDSQGSSTRPYLIRALHDWCTENGFTPYIAVFVDASVRVPPEYVKNNEIVLNIGLEATNALRLGNEFIEFKARFGGTARENGQGMAFPAPGTDAAEGAASARDASDARRGSPHLALAEDAPASSAPVREGPSAPKSGADPTEPPEPPTPGRPALKRVK